MPEIFTRTDFAGWYGACACNPCSGDDTGGGLRGGSSGDDGFLLSVAVTLVFPSGGIVVGVHVDVGMLVGVGGVMLVAVVSVGRWCW